MDKRQYKQLMEQIQMSDACEQRILDAVRQTSGLHLCKERFPLFFCHLLAVIQPCDQRPGRIQYYRRRIDISCERASAGLIDTAEQQAAAPFFRVPRVQFLCGLFRCSLCHYSASCSGSSSVILPSLPLRNSSSSTLAIRSVLISPRAIRKPRFRPASVRRP